ncbi:MAG: helix-turn-helix domain-containing protein [Gemmatimonadetes bacterium]|nr:helix-turn-helix domain-containing protein [Gemmatimonadota bacterium]MYE93041.1 helix-turn-helix domain-containing protein [Gemmatimonadota bacterium]MYJ10215.1 helix-turn-helix domain-containing protein [Gemmatimonadota bacterium]
MRLSRTKSTGKPPHSAGLDEGDQTPFLDEGLTVTVISRELGITRQTIYRWISGCRCA